MCFTQCMVNDLFASRPRTESFMIKQHLTLAVGLTQIVLLLSIAAYRTKVSMSTKLYTRAVLMSDLHRWRHLTTN